jgi:hypothetical protein
MAPRAAGIRGPIEAKVMAALSVPFRDNPWLNLAHSNGKEGRCFESGIYTISRMSETELRT